MLSSFAHRFEVLPEPQRRVWPQLREIPPHFVLYGGTALALRLGHRTSVDFDFFSSVPFNHDTLRGQISWLKTAEPLQAGENTLTVIVPQLAPVKVSFFGGLTFGRVGCPEHTQDNVVRVASLLDLAATKVAVIQQRAEAKDYLDVAALLKAGITLSQALGAASALYRETFNPMISLKALSYFNDGDLKQLPADLKHLLSDAAAAVTSLAEVQRVSDQLAPF
jgi:hypothetical protein